VTEGSTILFLFFLALGLLVIFSVVDNALRSHDGERQRHRSESS
jgi:hypothetical protein